MDTNAAGKLQFRYATAADAAPLAALATTAFWDTYRGLDEPQDIADYVSEHFNRPAVERVIADASNSVLLAEVEGRLAGFAIVSRSPAPACVTGPAPIELSRIYLDKAFIGHGHGARLMLAVHEEARRHGARTLWLGVYDRNVRAVAFYERFGFSKVGGKEFLFGGRIYIDPIYAAAVGESSR